jgi:hypothetical protein
MLDLYVKYEGHRKIGNQPRTIDEAHAATVVRAYMFKHPNHLVTQSVKTLSEGVPL